MTYNAIYDKSADTRVRDIGTIEHRNGDALPKEQVSYLVHIRQRRLVVLVTGLDVG